MIIAFCTACTDRRPQLAETLPHNLDALRGTGHLLALCDFNSRDDLPGLVQQHLEDVRAGTLLTFRTEEPSRFQIGQAQNTAHRLGLRRRPDVLCNLPAGSFVTAETLALVEEVLAPGPEGAPEAVLHNWSMTWGDASVGRIAMSADAFTRLGGYDESIPGLRWHEYDLLLRARASGMSYVLSPRGLRAEVPSTDEVANLAALNVESFVMTMQRPLRLEHGAQRRFRGRLGGGEEVVI